MERPWTNTTDRIQHLGGKMIRPGATRDVEETLLPGFAPAAAAVEPDMDAVLELLEGSVDTVKEAVPRLENEDLDRLEAAEIAGKARKGVLEAVANERLERAQITSGEG